MIRFDTSTIAGVLERAWQAIGAQHPTLPRAVIVVASGVELTHVARWGHWAATRWQVENGEHVGEVMIAGERFEMGAEFVLETLLHEAAHALAFAAGTKDTSRQGRYHNKKYKALAETVGLSCIQGSHGWNITELASGTSSVYAAVLSELTKICKMGYRRDVRAPLSGSGSESGSDPSGDSGTEAVDTADEKPKSRVSVSCECERKFRISASVLDLGPIVCGVCDTSFISGRKDRPQSAPEKP